MKIPFSGNWGLKLLALVLAVTVYYVLKNSAVTPRITHDRELPLKR